MTTLETAPSSRWAWLRGVTRAAPIVMGYVPIGFAYGVLAQQAGLSTRNTVLMSLLVYAGSAQLIATGLFAAGLEASATAPALSIILTTFVVNLRHLLMSAALSPYMRHWRKGELAAFAYELTDESFAVHIAQFTESTPPKAEVFAVNVTAQLSWILGSWLGAVAGRLITDVKPLALDYALPTMFIALLVMQIKDKRHIIVAAATGLLAVALTLSGLGHWAVIVAALIGATLGVLLEMGKSKIG